MNELSTAYPQVMHILHMVLIAWGTIAPIALYFYFKHLLLRDFPGKTTINTLRADVADFSGSIADLTERFARFQNKEGMRAAREAKAAEKDILAQAQEIVSQADAQGGDGSKIDLYNRRRKLS